MAGKPPAEIAVVGLAELSRLFRAAGGDLSEELREANKAAAEVVAAEARGRVPRRSGRLAKSIRATGGVRVAAVRAGGARMPYAGPIHFGWPAHNIRPQPFLYDAADDRRTEVIAVYEKNIADLIDRHF